MRKLIIAAALVSAGLGTPAVARDGAVYVGVDGGVVKPRHLKLTFINSAVAVPNGERLSQKTGYDVDGVVDYDFGMFRLEGELAYKHARLKDAALSPDAMAALFLGTTIKTIVPAATGRSNVLSGMVNGLIDFGPSNGLNGSVGLGAGEARANYRAGLVPSSALNFTGQSRAFAWQALAEVRYPISENVDIGLKYRYFQTAKLNFGPFCETTCTTALPYRLRGKYTSNSVLASLLFNFESRGSAATSAATSTSAATTAGHADLPRWLGDPRHGNMSASASASATTAAAGAAGRKRPVIR